MCEGVRRWREIVVAREFWAQSSRVWIQNRELCKTDFAAGGPDADRWGNARLPTVAGL